eukprot:m.118780 g.118780  ORF g.118780 m.118780 type:complete len:96 (-) comp13259_c0_seq3:59-346(-)
MGSNFADPYLCTTPEKFSAYASSKLHPKHRILGWLSVSAPDVQKVTEVKPTRLPGCTRFCSKSALANMYGSPRTFCFSPRKRQSRVQKSLFIRGI